MAKKASSAPPPGRGAPRQAPRPAPGAPRRFSSQILWFTVIVALLLPWILPSMIVVLVGMVPSIVALVVDRSPRKYGTLTIAALNFAGVLPYLVKLWAKSQNLENALNIVVDVFALMVMYGAAGFGWMIFLTIPTFVASIFMVISQRRIAVLRENQRKILEEWGESVARSESPAGKS
ncbi:MAG: hypothetical protein A3G73_03285 [Rhodospirillales bacterium RIFCSPLOWO2_12_FULL_67_15]|nr:MAG: hypothetical protein A3G73_03285 [Rhodospirillales bacterium RIFCSPLOWO2_12_FULL_67_15]